MANLQQSEIDLVRSTWKNAHKLGPDTVSHVFYSNLFQIAPDVKSLFDGTDFSVQGKKLVSMLDSAVNLLDDLPKLVPVLRELGVRHVHYKVKEAHYEAVGPALLKTLKDALGSEMNADAESAWGKVWGVVSSTMIGAAREASKE